ncbi:MAG TPA: ACP S-malonyltransferase [Acidimicrobiia bacterium]|nr:ACP S-malonyltransferase [Acidimicrobiia bacterium]
MGYAVLFPGQGSQFPGMGADLFSHRRDLLGERADQVLGWSLEEMCLEAPIEVLTRTEHAQPAIFAVSFALWDELASRLPVPPTAGAGHSLGEYTALAAASVLSYDDALALVAARGRAMAAAADAEPSGMAAVLGVTDEVAEEVAASRRREGGRLYVANRNAPGQVVLAGAVTDLEWLQREASALGLRRVIPLQVAGAFHTPFMAAAADSLRLTAEGMTFHPPTFPVYTNVSASPLPSVEGIAKTLHSQVVSPVLFAQSLSAMNRRGIGHFLHVGPGDVTAGLARKSVTDAATFVVSDLATIAPALDWLGTIG